MAGVPRPRSGDPGDPSRALQTAPGVATQPGEDRSWPVGEPCFAEDTRDGDLKRRGQIWGEESLARAGDTQNGDSK